MQGETVGAVLRANLIVGHLREPEFANRFDRQVVSYVSVLSVRNVNLRPREPVLD